MTNKYIQIIKPILIAIIVLIPVIAIGFVYFNKNIKNTDNTKSNQDSSISQASSLSSISSQSSSKAEIIFPKSLRLNTLFFGDIFWGRYVDDWSKASNLKFAYPFSGLNTFEKEKYNAWIGNLECPITSTYLTSKVQNNQLKFSCPVEYTPEAAKWFEAFSLANNHTNNMEEVGGFVQTRNNLEKNKIQYFGHYDNSNINDICEVVSFKASPVFDNNLTDTEEEYFIPIALCGFHNIFKLPTEQELAIITKYTKYFPTISFPHQGKEYVNKADKLQVQYARKMIDLGADSVISSHVHTAQNTEVYNNKLIIYSLGNFIFDQQQGNQVTQGVVANLDFNFVMDDNLKSYLEFSRTCIQFQDKCLESAEKLNLTKPIFTIKYDLLCSDSSKKLTKKATEAVCTNLYKITNWPQTVSKLN